MDALKALRGLAAGFVPLGRAGLKATDDGILTIIYPPPPSRVRFSLDGLMFHVLIDPNSQEGTTRMQMWAELGYLPYTAEDRVRRQALLSILRQTRDLKWAHFALLADQRILVFADVESQGMPAPDDFVFEAVRVLCEARPYLSIFAEYLTPLPRAAAVEAAAPPFA